MIYARLVVFGWDYRYCYFIVFYLFMYFSEAVNACALVEEINELPGRDNYNVGDGGAALSGGQKARISLARAVYKVRSF